MSIDWSINNVDLCSSTNAELAAGLKSGLYKIGSVLVAKIQTAGRGRLDRQWISPAKNLAFSCAIAAPKGVSKTPEISLVTGLALATTLESFTQGVQIKWPNDILINGKKVAGILSEVEGANIVVGIGVNWNSTSSDFPLELRPLLTTLADVTGIQQSQEAFFDYFFSRLTKELDRYAQNGLTDSLQDIETRLAYKNQTVSIRDGNHTYAATIIGINNQGHLCVKTSEGEIKELISGDVIPPALK
jgi:BirA family biotin operon repressor/biotin-[acetyl-CoA-carboxylase] ligase